MGNPGNAKDPGTGNLYGGVGYDYNISKFKTTIGQYTEFLNAVAATDTYDLYSIFMTTPNIAGIARNGSSGSYTYSTIDSPNKPISYVSWGDAARFANWLTNGQPTGAQGPGTTETGSYALNGATTTAAIQAVARDPSARYVIPTENEWYKAAYYDPTKGGSNYWQYPMRTDGPIYSDQPPGSDAPNAAFTANFFKNDNIANGYNDGYAATGSSSYLGVQNYLTDVGAYTSASSFYGTFDQGGGVAEWNETIVFSTFRVCRGTSFHGDEPTMRASSRLRNQPPDELLVGFRIAEVPEPATALLLLAALPLLSRRRERIAL